MMDRLLRGRMIAACSLLLTVSGGSSVVADPPAAKDVAAPASDTVPHYHAVVLETLPDEVYCIATGLNNARQICGYSQNQNRQNSPVTWDASGGAAKSLASPGGAAIAVNAKGVVVGSLKGHAALWKDRTLQDLGVPDGASSAQAFSINAKGDVVGGGLDGAKNPLPFLKPDGAPMKLLALPAGWSGGVAEHINDAGAIAGKVVKSSGDAHPCLWTDGKPADLGTLGGSHGEAQDVNVKGVVVGTTEAADGNAHACVWRDGKIHDLPMLPDGTTSAAHAINASGVIVGEGDISDAAVWIGDAVHNLNDLVIEKGYTLGNATAIDDNGDILAWGTIPGDEEVARAVLLIPQK